MIRLTTSRRADNLAPVQALAATARKAVRQARTISRSTSRSRRAAAGITLALAAALGMSAMASSAHATTITFETAAVGGYSGPTSEGGFDYSVGGGYLFLNEFGNDGQDMEGRADAGGGILKIVASDASLFTFTGLDYAAWSRVDGAQILTVTGLLGDAIVGIEQFPLNNTQIFVGGFDNWTFFGADALGLVNLDTLLITLNASTFPQAEFLQAVDNIRLETVTNVDVPEPATLGLLGTGLAGLALFSRRRRDKATPRRPAP